MRARKSGGKGSANSILTVMVTVLGAVAILGAAFGLYTFVSHQNTSKTLQTETQNRIEKDMILMTNVSDISNGLELLEEVVSNVTGMGILTPGVYGTSMYVSKITVNPMGFVSDLDEVQIDAVNFINTGVGLTGGPIAMAGVIALENTTVTPGTYTYATIDVDAQGRLTFANSGTDYGPAITANANDIVMINNVLNNLNMTINGDVNMSLVMILMDVETLKMKNATVREVRTGAGLTGGPINVDGEISLEVLMPDPSGTYASGSMIPQISVDEHGRVTSVTEVSVVAVTSIIAGTGLDGGTITTTGTINLADTNVTDGTYTYATIVVDPQGRLTYAASGTDFTSDISTINSEITMINNVLNSINMTINGDVNMTLGTLLMDVETLKMTAATVQNVTAGTGLNGGSITVSGTIDLADTTVTPNSYGSATSVATFTVDQQGRLTSASSVPISFPSAVTSIGAGTGLKVGMMDTNPITLTGTISLDVSGVTAGSYTYASITVDTYGRVTTASPGIAPVTSLVGGTGIDVTAGTTPTIDLADTSVTAGSYTYAAITVDDQGRLTSAGNGVQPVTSITGGVGIDVAGTVSTPVIDLANTTVATGSYTFASITVDSQGRLTAASDGTDYGPTIMTLQTDIMALETAISTLNMTGTIGVNMTLDALIMDVSMLKTTAATVQSITAGTGLSGGTITQSGTINLTDTAVTIGTYDFATITVDQQGRITFASTGTPVTSVTAGTGLEVTGGVSTPTVGLANTSVTAGSYTSADITVDAQGRITAAANGSGGGGAVTSVTAGSGMTVTPTTGAVVVSLPTLLTGGTVGSSTQIPVISLDAHGRVTSATTTGLSFGLHGSRYYYGRVVSEQTLTGQDINTGRISWTTIAQGGGFSSSNGFIQAPDSEWYHVCISIHATSVGRFALQRNSGISNPSFVFQGYGVGGTGGDNDLHNFCGLAQPIGQWFVQLINGASGSLTVRGSDYVTSGNPTRGTFISIVNIN